MNNWEKVKLSTLCFRIGDGLHGTPNYIESGDIYFINGNNIKGGKIVVDDETKRVTKEELDKNFVELNSNSLLLSINGTLGNMAFFNGENVMLGKSAAYLNFKTDINRFYFYYFQLPSIQKYFYDVATGSTIKNLSLKSLQDFEVPKPTVNDYKKIAKVLSDLDAKIELNNKINAELEAMAKTLYDYWFVQFDFPNEEGKPYKSSGGKMVWNEELKREIPDGWEVNELGNQIDLFDSKRIPLSSRERELKKGNVPYYGATGIMDYVDDYIFDGEYILMAEDGSVMDEKGLPIIQFIWGRTWVNNHAHVIRAKKVEQNEFYFQLMKRIPVVLIKTGSIQLKINQENLKKYKVLLPSKNLIDEYSKIAKSIREKLKNIFEQNKELASLRDWLLPMLMNGQVSVGDVEEQLGVVAEGNVGYKK